MNVLIVIDTRYGNTHRLALAVAEGAGKVAGAQVKLARAPVMEPEAIYNQQDERFQKAQTAFRKLPEATPADLEWCDALVLGSPTRFGNMSAPLKTFIDSTGKLWLTGGLIGKVGAAFCSTSSMHGGNETTLLTMMLPMLHHGMVIVGMPYSEPRMITTTRGGTPYGASSVSGPAADQGPNEDELLIAASFGQHLAETAAKLRG